MRNKKNGWLLIGILMGMIIGRLTIPEDVWGADFTMTQPDGQKYEECDFYPDDNQIKEAEQYLKDKGVNVPEDIAELCEYYGKEYNIAPELLEAIAWKESRFLQTAQDSSKTCKGLMQVKPSAHQARMKKLGVQNIFDKEGNIAVASDYLRELFDTWEDPAVVLAVYNGDKKAHKAGYVSGYAKEVMQISEALEAQKYGRPDNQTAR